MSLPASGVIAQCELSGYDFLGMYNGHAYYVSKARTGWVDARLNAEALGGHLAAIGDEEENLWLAAALEGGRAWIGMTDEGSEGRFGWSNGESLTYAHWAEGEPNNESNEDYVEINRFGQGHWNDVPSWVTYLPAAVEFGDADCDGVTDACDVCPGGDDNGPCRTLAFSGLGVIPKGWSCHPDGNKVLVCHNGTSVCLDPQAAQAHLDHGDFLGPCADCLQPRAAAASRFLAVDAYPSPVTDVLVVSIGGIEETAAIEIFDLWGRVVHRREVIADAYEMQIPVDRFGPGEHYVRVVSGKQTIVNPLVIHR